MNGIRIFFFLTLLLGALPALAERPKIGVALAGGGAKGGAHVAVLELLDAFQIPVDYIAGTSIGAYVGGLYALGYSAAEIRQIMQDADLNRGYSDAIAREALPYRIKQQKDRFNVPLDVGYRERQIRFPSGLLFGQTMSTLYRRSLGNIPNFASFDDLAIPFRAVATDLATSEAVVLSRGNLVRALQASAAVPGALVPVEIDGRLLVDGGIAHNLPISEVRRMGADIVIAVDISAPLLDKNELDNAVSVLQQMSRFLTLGNIELQKQLLEKDDIYIRPDVDDLSTTDFGTLDQAYAKGDAAARRHLPEFNALSIDAEAYRQYQQQKRDKLEALRSAGGQPIAQISLRNRSRISDAYILETLGISVDKRLSTDALIAAIERVYALDRFERVDAEFEQHEKGRVLVVETRGKSWGPNHFEAGLGWEDDFTLDSVINIDFAYTLGNLTDNDGEWRNEIGIGTNKRFASELYLPLDGSQKYYDSTRYELRKESRDLFIEDQSATPFELTAHRLDLGIGYRWSNSGIIEAGLTYENGEIGNELSGRRDLRYDSPGLFLRFGHDTLDRRSFPTRGTRLTFSIAHRREDIKGDLITGENSVDDDYRSTQYQLDWRGARSLGHHGLTGKVSLAYVDSDEDQSVHYTYLGGFLNLSGYHKNALLGNSKLFGALAYQYDLGRSLLGLKEFPLYLGVSIETGGVWLASDSITADDLLAAGSLYLGTDTRLGPVALGIGFAEGDQNSVYFYLGKNI